MTGSRKRVELLIGRVLQVGVSLAAVTMLLGGILYLSEAGGRPFNYGRFMGEPAVLIRPISILEGATRGESRSIMMLALLMLIATPVLRVMLSVAVFVLERDLVFAGITIFVLGVLVYSLAG